MTTYGTNINNSVGQIIYNLKDYRKQKYISTDRTGTGIVEKDSTIVQGLDDRLNIYEDLFKAGNILEKKEIRKLGIQAPPGTKFKINNDKEIVMGRTGIYELDERFPVKSLQFYKIPIYELQKNPTQQALQEGKKKMQEAVDTFNKEVELIPNPNTESYWQSYNEKYRKYVNDYEEAYSTFLRGINGVYLHKGDRELENIIIDYLYGQESQE